MSSAYDEFVQMCHQCLDVYVESCKVNSDLRDTKLHWKTVLLYPPVEKITNTNPTLADLLHNNAMQERDKILQEEYEERCEAIFPTAHLKSLVADRQREIQELIQVMQPSLARVLSDIKEKPDTLLIRAEHNRFGHVGYVFEQSFWALANSHFFVVPQQLSPVIDSQHIDWDTTLDLKGFLYPNQSFKIAKLHFVSLVLKITPHEWHDYAPLEGWLLTKPS